MLFIVANLAFGAAIVFYNAYLPDIASEDERDRVSSYGWAMGYLGGGILLALNLAFFTFGEDLGVPEDLAVRINLASAGIWWLGFSFSPGKDCAHVMRRAHASRRKSISIGFKQLSETMERRQIDRTLLFHHWQFLLGPLIAPLC